MSFYHPDTPISLNMMATPCVPQEGERGRDEEAVIVYEIADYIPDVYKENSVRYPEYNASTGDFYFMDKDTNKVVKIFNYFTGLYY